MAQIGVGSQLSPPTVHRGTTKDVSAHSRAMRKKFPNHSRNLSTEAEQLCKRVLRRQPQARLLPLLNVRSSTAITHHSRLDTSPLQSR